MKKKREVRSEVRLWCALCNILFLAEVTANLMYITGRNPAVENNGIYFHFIKIYLVKISITLEI